MKIAVVGKGGSGKSTISTLFAKYFSENKKVLAIDADYNMDLMNNLFLDSKKINFVNQSLSNFYEFLGVNDDSRSIEIFEKINTDSFCIDPIDDFTKHCSTNVSDNLKLMVSGGYSDALTFSSNCSHSYYRPLKYYLPGLRLNSDEITIIDSVAGTDMIGYGLYLGVDCLIVVVEPTMHSIGVFKQILNVGKSLGIDIRFVVNKFNNQPIIEEFMRDFGDLCLSIFSIDMDLVSMNFDSFIIKNLELFKQFEQKLYSSVKKQTFKDLSDRFQVYHKKLNLE